MGFCVVFGLLFLINVHPIGDGLWYWYAYALRQGQSLYRDLHVPMQPLFFVSTELFQRVFGASWLSSKVLAALQVFAYCYGLLLVCREIPWPDWRRAVLLVAVFGMTIMAFYSRFDDFHITGHCLVVYSIYLLLRLRREQRRASVLRTALVLGLLAGMGISNRLNDGGLLFASVAACLALFAITAWVWALLLYCVVAVLTLGLLVLAAHSSFHDWLQYTVIRAAAIKGGTQHILLAPFHFPYTIEQDLFKDTHLIRDFCFAAIVLAACAYVQYFRRLKGNRNIVPVTVVCGLTVGVLGLVLMQQSLSGSSVLSVSDACTIALYGLLLVLLLHVIHLFLTGRLQEWNRDEILILIPFGQIFSGAMTSGESFLEAYTPLAFFLLLLPLILPSIRRVPWQQVSYTALVAVLAVGSVISKTSHPYYWHHYNDRGMFLERTWYRHPNHGLMYIEKPQLELMQSMCAAMKPTTQPAELLAMPWPYPNYFCNVQPWHGYVQTWYDTTSKETLARLMSELETHPPEWIAYQRSFDTMRANEIAFNNWEPLPQRGIDRFMAIQLRSGRWSLPWQRCFGGTDWLLIHTRPAPPGETNQVLLPSSDQVNLCSRSSYQLGPMQ